MGKLDFKEFIRALKRSHRKQVYGRLFAVDAETKEVCGCALGQGLLEIGVVSEDEVRQELVSKNTIIERRIYDPVTQKKTLRRVFINSDYESRFGTLLDSLNEQSPTGSFTGDVVGANDASEATIPTILERFWNKWLPNGL
jgi:hypothetical protein